jgi:3'-phosphoadenosine 5'-phosphosulfate sulfotransferase (PAPS reductase)/FAD synthetase
MSQIDTIPGLPDALPDVPPKAREYQGLTLDQAIRRAHVILDEVLDRWPGESVFTLFSGGGDSTILTHLMRERTDAAVHVRTTVSIPETWEYVQAVCGAWDLPLHAAYPDDSYEDLVLGRVKPKTERGKLDAVWRGFPGPAGHYLMYQRLKERALERFRTSIIGPRGRSGQIVFLAGMRWAESDRRFRNASESDQWGAVVWCSPLVWWTNGHVAEYRARYMCHNQHTHAPHRLCHPDVLPLSEVSANLHMSGDCLCGAYAKPGEIHLIELFYPRVAARLHDVERQAREAGIPRCVWGAGKQPGDRAGVGAPGRLCARCVEPLDGQSDILDDWLQQGLITAQQHAAMTSPAEMATVDGAGVAG